MFKRYVFLPLSSGSTDIPYSMFCARKSQTSLPLLTTVLGPMNSVMYDFSKTIDMFNDEGTCWIFNKNYPLSFSLNSFPWFALTAENPNYMSYNNHVTKLMNHMINSQLNAAATQCDLVST